MADVGIKHNIIITKKMPDSSHLKRNIENELIILLNKRHTAIEHNIPDYFSRQCHNKDNFKQHFLTTVNLCYVTLLSDTYKR